MNVRPPIPDNIIRAYDIRGTTGHDIDAIAARAIGIGFAAAVREAGGRTVCLGRDGRTSSPNLAAALESGLAAGGVDTIRVGRLPTPSLYFAELHLGADAAVQVTGSHNPPDQNGMKFTLGGLPFAGDDIRRLPALAKSRAPGGGKVHGAEVLQNYVEAVAEEASADADPHVVWDLANGAAADAVPGLCERLPGRHEILNAEVDGNFPAHTPDPTAPGALDQLADRVREVGADLGFAFDGDGDRLGVVDARGRVLAGDQILALLAEPVVARVPGARVIHDVKSGIQLQHHLHELGATPDVCPTGHANVKRRMHETGAALAGEVSGHLFFGGADWYGFDDAPLAAVRVLSALHKRGGSLAEFLDHLPEVKTTPEIRIPCPDTDKFRAIDEVRENVTAENMRATTVDGVRVHRDGGWWLLRASNTEPVLTARCEGVDDASLGVVASDLRRHLREIGLPVPDQLIPAKAA